MYGAQTGIAAAVHSALTFIGGWSSPAKLFANNEQGAWYDPQDYGTSGFNGVGTLYQDSAGTTPVTAVEQPVGLMLDKRKGLVLGSEVVSNGGFSSGTDWTVPVAGASITGGALAFDGVTSIGAGVAVTTNTPVVSIVANKTYEVTYTIVGGTTNPVSVGVGGNTGTARTAAGTYTEKLLTSGTTGPAVYTRTSVGARTGSIDNISVKLLDGNHAYQSTSAARPTLRARYNQITYSEDVSNAVWVKNGLASTTASLMTEAATLAGHRIEQNSTSVNGASYTCAFEAKRNGRDIQFFLDSVAFGANAWVNFDLANGTVGTKGAAVTATITAASDGYYLCTITAPAIATGTATYYLALTNSTSASRNPSYSGDGASGAYVRKMDFRPTNLATGLIPTYQRIAAATDYDTVGFPVYIQGNGSSQFMLTSAIDFSGTDKMTVWSAVRKLSDAAQSCVAAIGLNGGTAGVNNEQGLLLAPGAAAATTYYWRATGSLTPTAATATGYTSPHSAVLAAQAEIATDLQSLRVNGAAAVLGSGDIGTGNFGSGQIIYLLARGGTTLWFGGYFYGAIIRGAASNEAQIQLGERYLQQRSLAY